MIPSEIVFLAYEESGNYPDYTSAITFLEGDELTNKTNNDNNGSNQERKSCSKTSSSQTRNNKNQFSSPHSQSKTRIKKDAATWKPSARRQSQEAYMIRKSNSNSISRIHQSSSTGNLISRSRNSEFSGSSRQLYTKSSMRRCKSSSIVYLGKSNQKESNNECKTTNDEQSSPRNKVSIRRCSNAGSPLQQQQQNTHTRCTSRRNLSPKSSKTTAINNNKLALESPRKSKNNHVRTSPRQKKLSMSPNPSTPRVSRRKVVSSSNLRSSTVSQNKSSRGQLEVQQSQSDKHFKNHANQILSTSKGKGLNVSQIATSSFDKRSNRRQQQRSKSNTCNARIKHVEASYKAVGVSLKGKESSPIDFGISDECPISPILSSEMHNKPSLKRLEASPRDVSRSRSLLSLQDYQKCSLTTQVQALSHNTNNIGNEEKMKTIALLDQQQLLNKAANRKDNEMLSPWIKRRIMMTNSIKHIHSENSLRKLSSIE